MGEKIEIKTILVDSSFILSTLLPDETILAQFKEHIDSFRRNEVFFKSCELLKYEICNSLKSAILQKRISAEKAMILYSAFVLMKIEF